MRPVHNIRAVLKLAHALCLLIISGVADGFAPLHAAVRIHLDKGVVVIACSAGVAFGAAEYISAVKGLLHKSAKVVIGSSESGFESFWLGRCSDTEHQYIRSCKKDEV